MTVFAVFNFCAKLGPKIVDTDFCISLLAFCTATHCRCFDYKLNAYTALVGILAWLRIFIADLRLIDHHGTLPKRIKKLTL